MAGGNTSTCPPWRQPAKRQRDAGDSQRRSAEAAGEEVLAAEAGEDALAAAVAEEALPAAGEEITECKLLGLAFQFQAM